MFERVFIVPDACRGGRSCAGATEAALRSRQDESALTAHILEHSSDGELEMYVNINGAEAHFEQMLAGEGLLLKDIREHNIGRIYIGEPHFKASTAAELETAVSMVKQALEYATSAPWHVFINACKDRKYAGTMACVKQTLGQPVPKFYSRVLANGKPTNSGAHSATPALAEGRITIIMYESDENLHDTVVLYSPNTGAADHRLHAQIEMNFIVALFKQWHQQYQSSAPLRQKLL